MTDAEPMIHANGHTMLVSREGLKEAIDRIGYLYGGPTGFRRPEGRASFLHRHARFFTVWLLSKNAPVIGRSGSGAHGRAFLDFICGATSAPRRRFLSPPGPLRVTGSGAAFEPCPA